MDRYALLLSQSVQSRVSCPLQVLVVDRVGGPADLLMDVVGRLLGCGVVVTLVAGQQDAVCVADGGFWDLVVIGLERDRPDNVALVPYFREQCYALPVVVVGDVVHHRTRDRALDFGAVEVLSLPRRAVELKEFCVRFFGSEYTKKD